MKRKFLLAVTAASLMAGCTKNDQLDAPASKEVGFSTYVNANTKGLAKTEFKIGDNFAVMATKSVNAWTSDDATWFMGGGTDKFITVTNSPSTAGASLWKYNPVVLWPESEAVSFFAFSPAPTAADKHGITAVDATKGSPTLKFEVNADVKQQVDLLRAEALDKFEEEIQLQFGHALTKVSFAAKAQVTANQRVRLDAIKLVGIKNTGELQLYNKDRKLGALDDMGGWSNQAGSVAYAPALSHEVVGEVPTTLTAMTAADQTLFMIPQEFTLNGGANLEVTYSYSHDGGQKWINGSILKIDLGETTKYWNPGKSYRYVLTLAPADIYDFSADIIDWNSDITVELPKDALTITKMDLDIVAGKSQAFTVYDTRGDNFGYTLTSSDATWLKIADNATGKGAAGELIYATDGTAATKAYEVEKEWYVVTEPNKSGAPRSATITIARSFMKPEVFTVNQFGFEPFKTSPTITKAVVELKEIYKVTDVAAPSVGSTYKLKTNSSWYKLSTDGQGNGAAEVDLTPSDTPTAFYIHVTSNASTTARTKADVIFKAISADGGTIDTLGIYTVVGQNGVPSGATYLGRFAGTAKKIQIGDETYGYYDKGLYMSPSDEATTYSYGPISTTNVTNEFDGKANTLALNSTTYPAARACATKSSGSWFLPSKVQVSCIFVIGTVLEANFYVSSTEQTATYCYSQYGQNGEIGARTKTDVVKVRCTQQSN